MLRSTLRGWLTNHPRSVAALFTLTLLIAQAQTAAAELGILHASGNPGSP